jgi:hypothetical protein
MDLLRLSKLLDCLRRVLLADCRSEKRTFIIRSAKVLGLCMFVSAPWSATAWAQCQYVDPRTSVSGYEAWCRCVGGTPYSPYNNGVNTACHPPSSSSGSGTVNSAVGNALEQGLRPIGQALGRKIAGWLFGTSNSNDTTSAAAAGTDADRQRMIEEAQRQAQLEHERQAALERQARERWKMELDELSRQMKGSMPAGSDLPMKDTQTAELEFKNTEDIRVAQPITDPIKQLRVSTCLMKLAAHAKSRDEAGYLAQQATLAMNGGPVAVDVGVCEGAPDVPAVGAAGPVGGPAPLSPQQQSFYHSLLDNVNLQTDQLGRLEQREKELKKKRQDVQDEIKNTKQRIEETQQQLAPPGDPDAQQKKQSALAEAQAALQRAQQEDAEDSRELADIENQQKRVVEKLKQYDSCADQAKQNPGKVGELSRTCLLSSSK